MAPLVPFSVRNSRVPREARREKEKYKLAGGVGGTIYDSSVAGIRRFSIRWKVRWKNRPDEFDRPRGISLSCRNLGAFDRRWRCYANVWGLRGMQSVLKRLNKSLEWTFGSETRYTVHIDIYPRINDRVLIERLHRTINIYC